MNSSAKILVCGMPRSMTTWAFNVLRVLVAAPDMRNLWIAPGSPEETQFASSGGPMLAKCHHFSPRLARSADLVVYSYRDLRAAAVSYHRKFSSPCTREQLDNWVEAERAWLPHADAVLRYEDAERDPLGTIAELRRLVLRQSPPVPLADLTDRQVLEHVDRSFEATQEGSRIAYDASTMILPAHRTFQPEAESLPPAEKALYDRVGEDFAAWLGAHDYIEANDHGQEVEYRIAADFLAAFEAATVVDVGVERGSFTELALERGSRRVIGFEPLPRHFEYLAQRYAGRDDVQVHRLALSNRSGTAQFHIATDAQGHELDYHHSLGELGDSATVIRSKRSIEVPIASLSDLARDGVVPAGIDFLKVDTDGHDLAVLEGLGELRPRVIMAEYWDNLPESSGANPYTLADLASWARGHGYAGMIVVRRHGRIELVQVDAPWSVAGDWGNVFFLRGDCPWSAIAQTVNRHSRGSYENLCAYVAVLMKETEAKEAEIRRLDAALQESRGHPGGQPPAETAAGAQTAAIHTQLAEKEALIQALHTQGQAVQAQLVEKEVAIQALSKAAAQLQASLGERNGHAAGKPSFIEALDRAVEHFGVQHRALVKDMEDKDSIIATLQKAIAQSDEQRRSLARVVEEKEADIRGLYLAVDSPDVHLMMVKSLREKEDVIQELSNALASYRAAFSVLGGVFLPVARARARFASILNRLRGIVAPRLGVLSQHAPRALRLPRNDAAPLRLDSAPRISIVTPSFRQATFIERTIQSVLAQSYPNLEYHVQDGASDDGTREILQRYADRLAGWESQPDSGQTEAINRGFARTSGEIMAWLNSDDILLPGALAYVADYFNRHPEIDVVYGHRILVDENDQEIGRWIMPGHDDDVLSWADYIPQETLFWRRSIWDKAGAKVDESFRFAMDWDLLVRFRAAGAHFACLPRFLGGFRIHPQQKTSAVINDVGFREMDRIRERELGRVPSRAEIGKAVFPYLLKHTLTDLGWRIRGKLGART